MAANHKRLLKEVNNNPNFEFLENGKIHCTITKHDLLPTVKEFHNYLNSKSYKKGLDSEVNEEDYLPYLVPYNRDEKFMFCKLTKSKLQRKNSILGKHINGKKMQQLIKEFEEKEKQKEENKKKEEDDIFETELIDQQLDKFEEQKAEKELLKAKKEKKKKQVVKKGIKKTEVKREEKEEIIKKKVPVQPIQKKKIQKLKKPQKPQKLRK